MKKFIKYLTWLAGIILVAVILVGLGLYFFFPKEKVKALALDKLSASLNREITIDGVAVSFSGGIGLKLENLKIANAPGFKEKHMLTADNLDVKVRLWPLLKKQIMIDRLVLNRPVIIAVKLKDGRVNYDFAGAEEQVPPEIKEKLPEDTRAAGAMITFDNLTINDGHIIYRDDSSSVVLNLEGLDLSSSLTSSKSLIYKSAGDLKIKNCTVRFVDMALPVFALALDYEATADLNNSQAVIKMPEVLINKIKLNVNLGIPNLKTMSFINAQIKTAMVSFTDLLAFVPENKKTRFSGFDFGGFVSIDAALKYNGNAEKSFDYEGTATIKDLTLARKTEPGLLSIAEGAAAFETDKIGLEIKKGSFENNPITGLITVENLDNPSIKANLKGTVDLSSLMKFISTEPKPKLSGNVTFELNIVGPIERKDQLAISGSIKVDGASYAAEALPEPIENFSADLVITPRKIDIKALRAQFPSSDISLTGTLADPFPYLIPGFEGTANKPYLIFTAKSNRFDVDKLFPEAAPGVGAGLSQVPIDSLPPLPIPDIDGKGIGQIDTLIYTKVEFTAITSDMSIKERILYADNVKGNVYTGKVTGQAAVDLSNLNNPVYTGQFDARQIEANDFLSRFTGFGGHLFGKLDMKGDFTASGLEPMQFLNSLTMKGDAFFKEARLVGFDLFDKLADQVKLKKLGEEKLRDFASAFHVVDGRVHFDATKFISNFGDWDIAGSVGFDGSLDYKGTLLLSNDMTAQATTQFGAVAGLLKDRQTGRIKLPLTLGGTYSSPRVGLNLSGTDSVKGNLQESVSDALKNLLGK